MATKKVKEVRVIFKRVKDIWSKTFGFTIVRAAWSLVYGLVKILLILLFLWLIVKTNSVAGLIIGLIGIGIVLGISKDRKSTRLNSSHVRTSYADFCWKKKKTKPHLSKTKQ